MRSSQRRICFDLPLLSIPIALFGACNVAEAIDIQGVLPAAADQPQTHALIRVVNPDGTPGDYLTADDGYGDTVYDIQGFLDTGTSGVLLSEETQTGLGVAIENNISFQDVAVGGTDTYNVSTPYYISTAPFSIDNDSTIFGTPPDPSAYTNTTPAPIRMETNPVPVDPTDPFAEPLDIFGMPVMQGKVVTLDIRPDNDPNNLGETRTYIYDPGTSFKAGTIDTDPGIPITKYHVKLSYADFSQFTQLQPAGTPASYTPKQYANPMIGPDPVKLFNTGKTDNTAPITLTYNGHTSTGSFLFDTGAQASFISSAEAANLGVVYGPGTDSNGDPYLVDATTGVALANQFVVPISGAGGNTVDAVGFNLDSLTLQTMEGVPINFPSAPVLVTDITVQDPNSGKSLTLDGDFGMNFLEPSLSLDGSQENASPFNWVTFDQPNGILGLTLATDIVEPNDIPDATTTTAASDSDIGDAGTAMSFSGGILAVTSSFSTSRAISVNSEGGAIDVAGGATLTLSPTFLNWAGGTLLTTDSGTVVFAMTAGGTVAVTPDTVLSIDTNSTVIVNGTVDPFTDSVTGVDHVAIFNNGSLAVNANCAVAGITGAGQLSIGTSTSHNTLQLATGSGQSTVASLAIAGGSTLDITNNNLIINYTGADPYTAIMAYAKAGYNGGGENGAGIISSTAALTANNGHYSVGYADGKDGLAAGISSGQIEIAYTLYGDCTLQGVVTGVDFTILAEHFGQNVTGGWEDGDFTNSGVVTGVDFTLMAENFGQSANGTAVALPATDWQELDAFAAAHGLAADVPEPASVTMILAGAACALCRRRRKNALPSPIRA